MGTLAAGPVDGMALASGSTASRGYKNLERGFAKNNPLWKIKRLYPSTSSIDKSISNAYKPRDNKNLKNKDSLKDGASSAIKNASSVIKNMGLSLYKTLPINMVMNNLYQLYQSRNGISDEKIHKIEILMKELKEVIEDEFLSANSANSAMTRSGISELKQSGTKRFNLGLQYRDSGGFIISRDALYKKLESTESHIEENRSFLRKIVIQSK